MRLWNPCKASPPLTEGATEGFTARGGRRAEIGLGTDEVGTEGGLGAGGALGNEAEGVVRPLGRHGRRSRGTGGVAAQGYTLGSPPRSWLETEGEGEVLPLEYLRGKPVVCLSGLGAPQGFEETVKRKVGGTQGGTGSGPLLGSPRS